MFKHWISVLFNPSYGNTLDIQLNFLLSLSIAFTVIV